MLKKALVVGFTLLSLNLYAQSEEEVVFTPGTPVPITVDNVGEAIADANDIYQASIIKTDELPLYVVMDVTRGSSEARVYQYGKLIRSYPIHGGINQLTKNGRGENTCAFTTTGRLMPTALVKDKTSSENGNAPMPFYVELDGERGLGAHQGNLNGYSHACIRQGRKDADWLYQQIQTVSEMRGSRVLKTGAVFDIIDNTPGIAQAKRECLRKCRKARRCTTPHLFDIDRPIRDLSTKNFKRILPSLLQDHMRFNQHDAPE